MLVPTSYASLHVLQALKAIRDMLKLPEKRHYYPQLNGGNVIVTSSSTSSSSPHIEGPTLKLAGIECGTYTRDGTVPIIMPKDATRSEVHAGGCHPNAASAPPQPPSCALVLDYKACLSSSAL